MATPLTVLPVETPAPVTTPVPSNNDGDHERFAHYVKNRRFKGAEALVLEARINGTEVEALCGKRWVPSRDPERFPVCPTCAEMAKGMKGARE